MIALADRKSLFYNQNAIVVRESELGDIAYLKNYLRASDIEEIFASNHHTPEEALTVGFRESTICLTVLNCGIPSAMFGVNAKTLFSESGIIWLLATDDLAKIKIRFLRHCQPFIRLLLKYYPFLWNYCDARNAEALAWLRFCGATITPAEPYGIEQKDFHFFYFKKR